MKIYFFVAMMLFSVFAYFVGGQVALQKCERQIAEIKAENQFTVINTIGKINEETFNTGVRDIRRILHEQYTIVE